MTPLHVARAQREREQYPGALLKKQKPVSVVGCIGQAISGHAHAFPPEMRSAIVVPRPAPLRSPSGTGHQAWSIALRPARWLARPQLAARLETSPASR